MATEKRLIDANALIANGWHLVKTGESNKFLASMSLADVPIVDAVVLPCKMCDPVYIIRECSCYGADENWKNKRKKISLNYFIPLGCLLCEIENVGNFYASLYLQKTLKNTQFLTCRILRPILGRFFIYLAQKLVVQSLFFWKGSLLTLI